MGRTVFIALNISSTLLLFCQFSIAFSGLLYCCRLLRECTREGTSFKNGAIFVNIFFCLKGEFAKVPRFSGIYCQLILNKDAETFFWVYGLHIWDFQIIHNQATFVKIYFFCLRCEFAKIHIFPQKSQLIQKVGVKNFHWVYGPSTRNFWFFFTMGQFS